MNSKIITLCADDFGLSAAISQSILHLVELQRLSAVSCMVNRPSFNEHVELLLNRQDNVQIGLHFNLTEGYFLSKPDKACFDLKELLLKTHLHLVKPSFIAREFNAQLDCYINKMGTLPDFIDGHQHVHQFPQIRQVILAVYEARLRAHGTWIRATYPIHTLPGQKVKSWVLARTGGRQLSCILKKRNIPHLPAFSGIYDFAPDADYRSLFRQCLARVPTGSLIMCHPGSGNASDDPIALARQNELAYFLSDTFVTDCQEFHVRLAAGPKSGQ